MAERKYEEVKGGDLWLPKEGGEQREGKVTGINPKGLYGLSVTILSKDGAEILLPSHKMLQSQLVKAQLKVGDYIRITYIGNKQGHKNDYEEYKLEKALN